MNQQLFPEIQANILRPHGREHMRCYFLKLGLERKDNVAWVNHLGKQLTSMKTWLQMKADHKGSRYEDRPNVIGAYLTYSGYNKLGATPNELPRDPSFLKGMKNGEVNGRLKDIPSGYWNGDYRKSIDLMVMVATNKSDDASYEDIEEQLFKGFTGEILFEENGGKLRSEGKIVEHFGYIDGTSDPQMIDDDQNLIDANWKWAFEQPSMGSYLVFRKLEQNVKLFNEEIRRITRDLSRAAGKPIDEAFVEAQVMGRFKKGGGLLDRQATPGGIGESQFVYSETDGSKCPFHAHIRKVNPRDGSIDSESARIVRRGMTYGKRKRGMTDEPEKGVGLLFMCFQASILNQFERIHIDWGNNEDFPGDTTGRDPLFGQGLPSNYTQKWNAEWGNPNSKHTLRRKFKKVVSLIGGEYFHAPLIGYLKNLKYRPPEKKGVRTASQLIQQQTRDMGYAQASGVQKTMYRYG